MEGFGKRDRTQRVLYNAPYDETTSTGRTDAKHARIRAEFAQMKRDAKAAAAAAGNPELIAAIDKCNPDDYIAFREADEAAAAMPKLTKYDISGMSEADLSAYFGTMTMDTKGGGVRQVGGQLRELTILALLTMSKYKPTIIVDIFIKAPQLALEVLHKLNSLHYCFWFYGTKYIFKPLLIALFNWIESAIRDPETLYNTIAKTVIITVKGAGAAFTFAIDFLRTLDILAMRFADWYNDPTGMDALRTHIAELHERLETEKKAFLDKLAEQEGRQTEKIMAREAKIAETQMAKDRLTILRNSRNDFDLKTASLDEKQIAASTGYPGLLIHQHNAERRSGAAADGKGAMKSTATHKHPTERMRGMGSAGHSWRIGRGMERRGEESTRSALGTAPRSRSRSGSRSEERGDKGAGGSDPLARRSRKGGGKRHIKKRTNKKKETKHRNPKKKDHRRTKRR